MQVQNICATTIVQGAWERKQPLSVHGWVYSIEDGLLHEIRSGIESRAALHKAFHVDSDGLAAADPPQGTP